MARPDLGSLLRLALGYASPPGEAELEEARARFAQELERLRALNAELRSTPAPAPAGTHERTT